MAELVQHSEPNAATAATSAPTRLSTDGSPPSESRSKTLSPGTVLGERYQVLSLLGEGGMGAVYKAEDLKLNRLVAVKVIRRELADDLQAMQRFKQELILAREVTHRNVVRLYDLGEAEGIDFITMEFIQGEDLGTILHRQGKLVPGEAAEIISQVCSGLQAAHAQGITTQVGGEGCMCWKQQFQGTAAAERTRECPIPQGQNH